MAIKDKGEARWLEVRDVIRDRQARLDEMQKVIEERIVELKTSWKKEVFKMVDGAFCLVMETLEGAFSRLHKAPPEVNGLQYGVDGRPDNGWVQ